MFKLNQSLSVTDKYIFIGAVVSLLILYFFSANLLSTLLRFSGTILHEFMHGFIGSLTGSTTQAITFNFNQGGGASATVVSAHTLIGYISRFLVAIVGYTVGLPFVYIALKLIANQKYEILLAIFGLILVYVFFKSNQKIILTILIALCIVAVYLATQKFGVNLFLPTVLLLLISWIAVGNIIDTLILGQYLSSWHPEGVQDAMLLKSYTFIPAVLWIVFFITWNLGWMYKIITDMFVK